VLGMQRERDVLYVLQVCQREREGPRGRCAVFVSTGSLEREILKGYAVRGARVPDT